MSVLELEVLESLFVCQCHHLNSLDDNIGDGNLGNFTARYYTSGVLGP